MKVLSQSSIILSPAMVIAIYTNDRTIDVRWMGHEGVRRGIVVIDGFGLYSFPEVGDTVLILGTGIDYFCIGKIEFGYRAKLDGKLMNPDSGKVIKFKEVDGGEVYLSNIKRKTWLSLPNSGDVSLLNGFSEGFKYLRSLRLSRLAGRTIEFVSNGVKVGFGNAIRNIPSQGEQPVSGSSGGKALEYYIQVAYNSIQTVRFHLGEITDLASGVVPEVGSFGSRIKALLEVTAGAVKLAYLHMDELGNAELKSETAKVVVAGLEVLLGSNVAVEPLVKGTTYTTAESTFLDAFSSFLDTMTAFFTAVTASTTTAPTAPIDLAAQTAPWLAAVATMKAAVSAFDSSLQGSLSATVKTS